MGTYVVIAQPEEIELVKRFGLTDYPIIITGVGGINVVNKLKHLPKDSEILNVGYCGGQHHNVGDVLNIKYVHTFHNVADFDDALKCNTRRNEVMMMEESICYTSTDFVQNFKKGIEKCVFDMELAFIRAMFDDVTAIKVVSDKLNYDEYKKNVEG